MDRQRLAEALAYEQQRRSRLANVIPTAQPGDPEVIPEQGVRSRLENLSSGLGQGGVNTLEGLRQLVTSPIETGRAMVEGGVEMIRDPALIAEALRQMGQTAASGPLGLGEVIGEAVNPMRARLPGDRMAMTDSVVELPRTATVIEARATKAGRNLPDLEAELAKEGFTLQETPSGNVEVYGKKLGADPTVPQKLETVKEGGKGAAIQSAKNLQRKEAADIEKAKARSPFDEFEDFGNLDDYIEDRPELLQTLMRRKINVAEPEIADVSPSFKNRNYRVKFKTGEEFSVNDVSAKTLAELKDQVKRDQIYDQIPAQLQGQTVRDLIETLGWQERSPQYIRDVLTGKRKLKLDE
jgi:hypothetical protein